MRRDQVAGRKRRLGVALGGLLLTAALAAPTIASAGLLGDAVGNAQDTVGSTVNGVLGNSGGGSSGGATGSSGSSGVPAPAPVAGPTPTPQDATDTPELDGTDPHGEGEVVETTIENPLGDPIGVTVGQSRGEQNPDGSYHGVVNILVLDNLPLIGDQSIGVETNEGETAESPIGAINDSLDQVCTAADVCLALLDYRSKTGNNGSKNRFSAARASVLGDVVEAGVVESDGNISDDGECQTADSSSTATNVGVAGDAISADALESSSESTACQDGTSTATGDSEVIDLGALQLLDPLSLIGCDPTAVDDDFGIPLVVEGICNGDDTNGTQADAPYNTRTAIQIEVLGDVLGILGVQLDLDGSPSESLARPPEEVDECPDRSNPDCPPIDECPDPTNPDCLPNPPNPHDLHNSHGPAGPDGPGGPSASASASGGRQPPLHGRRRRNARSDRSDRDGIGPRPDGAGRPPAPGWRRSKLGIRSA